jgi:hypothetical protein
MFRGNETRVGASECRQPKLGQARAGEVGRVIVTGSKEHRDTLRLETAHSKEKGVGRGTVDPLGVVDENENRLCFSCFGEEREDAE